MNRQDIKTQITKWQHLLICAIKADSAPAQMIAIEQIETYRAQLKG